VTLTIPVPIQEKLDLVYGQGGGEELRLDLFAPRDQEGPFPAVVLLHGGGWTFGGKGDCRSMCREIAAQGYVAVTVDYRLSPKYKFPAQIEDVKCAVRWLRANARLYHVNPQAIGAIGSSAGGHLALLAGLTQPADGLEGEGGHPEQSSTVQAVVNLYGPTDLSRNNWPAPLEKVLSEFVGGNRDQLGVAYWTASPLAYVRKGGPPVLTIHGTADPVVPYDQATLLDSALRSAGLTSSLVSLKDKGHGDWSPEEWQRCTALIVAFTDKHLKRQ
jgi:acetyl esterase/lipase